VVQARFTVIVRTYYVDLVYFCTWSILLC